MQSLDDRYAEAIKWPYALGWCKRKAISVNRGDTIVYPIFYAIAIGLEVGTYGIEADCVGWLFGKPGGWLKEERLEVYNSCSLYRIKNPRMNEVAEHKYRSLAKFLPVGELMNLINASTEDVSINQKLLTEVLTQLLERDHFAKGVFDE
jgi:hypothetical protein